MRILDRFTAWKILFSAAGALMLWPSLASAQVATTARKFVVFASPFTQAGVQTPVEVQALDIHDRLVRTFNGPADVTSTDGAAIFPPTITLVNGRANLTITYNTGGSQMLNVTATAFPTIFGAATTNVAQAGGPTHIAVLFSPLTWTGQPTYGELIARTATNGVLTSYNGTVNLTVSDATAIHPATVRFRRGVADIKITFKTQGSQTVRVIDTVNAGLFGSQTTAVGTR